MPDRFERMFQSHASVMLMLEPNSGHILEANAAAAAFYAISREQLCDLSIQKLHPGGPCALGQVLDQMRPCTQTKVMAHRLVTGELRHVEVHASRVGLREDDVLFVILHDVTERVRAEEDKRKTESKFRALIEHALDMIVVIDAHGAFTFASPSLERIMGYPLDALMGQNAKSMCHPDDMELLEEQWHELMTHPGRVVQMTYRMRHETGPWRIISASARNMFHVDAVNGIVLNARDITEQMEAHEELLERKAQLAEAQALAHVGSWEWDLETDTLHWSYELWRIFGILETSSGIDMDQYMRAIHPDDRAELSAHVSRCLEDFEPFEVQHRIIRPSGQVRAVVGWGRVVVDEYDQPIRLYGSCQDVTELRAQEIELTQYAKRLEASNRELEEFAYVASHDLQEPLRKIRAFGDRLQRKYADELGDTGRDYLNRMDSAATRMSTLIEDLLTYSRVTTRARPFEPIDLQDLVRGVLSDLEVCCAESHAQIEVDDLPSIEADATQMRQLFQNLIGNAVKFRKPEEHAHLQIRARVIEGAHNEGTPDRLELRFEDHGIGFDQKYADSIFSPFQRLHSRSQYKGTGIGLAICRKIAEQHHGSIAAFAAPDEGATFLVTIPMTHPRPRDLT